MASGYSIENANIALTAATTKSVLVATAAAGGPFKVIEFSVCSDATATGLLKAEFLVGTLSAGTTGTAPTIARVNVEAYARAATTTASYYTAEPTYTKHASNGALAVKTLMIPLPATPYDIEYPLGREWSCPASNVLAIRLTSTTVSPNTWTNLIIEEG